MEEKPKISEADGYAGKWHGAEAEAKSSPILDPYTGETLILRRFDFALNPERKGTITKQDLFSHHEREIKDILRHDGWVAMEDIPPRLQVSKDGRYYAIYVACKLRFTNAGLKTTVHERPRTLNEYMQKQ